MKTDKNKTLIIAEAGVNHNGSISLAKKLIIAAKKSGADIVKFQSFIAENLVTKSASKADYQKKTTKRAESQYAMLKKLQLNESDHHILKKFSEEKKIEFLSSPFDVEGVRFLQKLKLKRIKIPSGEITNFPLLEYIGKLKKEVILSTGMSDLKEISDALNILSENGLSRKKIKLLHCNTEYPTPLDDINLKAIITMKKKFKIEVGYSDHSSSTLAPSFAVLLGASIIEKHLTLDKNMIGPDHAASLDPKEFKEMVENIRIAEASLGSGIKAPSKSELKNIPIARKSIVAKKDIKSGDLFTEKNIIPKRPGHGLNPMNWNQVIGKKAKKDFKKDEFIKI